MRLSASPFAYLLEKYGLEVDQNGLDLDLFLVSRLSKLLYSFFDLGFLALISNCDQFINAECSVLLT